MDKIYLSPNNHIGDYMPALGIGMLASSAMEAMGRNPEAAKSIQSAMIWLSLSANIAIYALVVALIIKFIGNAVLYLNIFHGNYYKTH